jgi:DNA end-binding protein Ku
MKGRSSVAESKYDGNETGADDRRPTRIGALTSMAPRAFWKGYLKLSLVTCPVALIPATTDGEKIRFHTLNRKTGNRVVSQFYDEGTGDPVDEADEAKGYARGENDYLILEDEELESVKLESARTIDIESFAPADSIDWIWYDTPFYLIPDDPVGEEAFCVIRDAMRASAMVGVSRLVLYRREHAVVLKARGKGIELWTLRYGDEVRDARDIFDKLEDRDRDPELLRLISELIEERKAPWSAEMVRDPVQERLSELINEKKRGATRRPAAKPEPEEAPSNVVNIMDALRRSVAAESKTKPPRSPKGR